MDPRSPDPIDQHVGARIRMRREDLRVSQEALGKALGISFQQVQKYERGQNRISASRLAGVARRLQTPIPWFFEGIEVDAEQPALSGEGADLYRRIIMSSGGQRMIVAYLQLGPVDRGHVQGIAERLAELTCTEGRA